MLLQMLSSCHSIGQFNSPMLIRDRIMTHLVKELLHFLGSFLVHCVAHATETECSFHAAPHVVFHIVICFRLCLICCKISISKLWYPLKNIWSCSNNHCNGLQDTHSSQGASLVSIEEHLELLQQSLQRIARHSFISRSELEKTRW